MAQKTFVAGNVLTAADVNTYLAGEGGAWTSYTPTVTQSTTVSKSVTYSRYARYGRTIVFNCLMSVTSGTAGTADNDITISLPVATATTFMNGCAIGTGQIYDASANLIYHGILIATSTTVAKIAHTTAAGATGGSFYLGKSVFTAALANTDSITIACTYEAAS